MLYCFEVATRAPIKGVEKSGKEKEIETKQFGEAYARSRGVYPTYVGYHTIVLYIRRI